MKLTCERLPGTGTPLSSTRCIRKIQLCMLNTGWRMAFVYVIPGALRACVSFHVAHVVVEQPPITLSMPKSFVA